MFTENWREKLIHPKNYKYYSSEFCYRVIFSFRSYNFNKLFQKTNSDWQFSTYSKVKPVDYKLVTSCIKVSWKIYVLLSVEYLMLFSMILQGIVFSFCLDFEYQAQLKHWNRFEVIVANYKELSWTFCEYMLLRIGYLEKGMSIAKELH